MNSIKKRFLSLLSAPGEELGRWKRFLRFHMRIAVLCAKRLGDQNAMQMSSAISFRIILALVPTLVLSALVLRSMGAFDSGEWVHALLTRSGITDIVVPRSDADSLATQPSDPVAVTQPTQSAPSQQQSAETQPVEVYNLADVLQRLIRQIERKVSLGIIGPIGALLLIWSALTLMMTIERALNRIFDAPQNRSFWKRILTYWAALTLGPLVLAVANYVGEQLRQLAETIPGIGWLISTTGWLQGVLIGLLFLAAVYKLVPNTRVSFRVALGGAIIAGPLWMLARYGFTLYVVGLAGKPSLYGALGLLPLFLIWMNVSVYILLFGATVAYAGLNVASFDAMQGAENRNLFTWSDSLAILVAIYGAFQQQRGPLTRAELAEKVRINEAALEQLIEDLSDRGWICITKMDESEILSPAKPANQISLGTLLGPRDMDHRGYESSVQDRVTQATQRNAESLNLKTLDDVLQLPESNRSTN